MNILNLVISILEQAFLFGLVAIGVYITYKILDFADLSVEGTYPLGASVAAVLLVKGFDPWSATLGAMIAGAIAGFITAFLNVKLKITSLMSGILVMLALYSINLVIMGKSNTSLYNNVETIFKRGSSKLVIIVIILLIVKILMDLFMKTKIGYLLFAVGDNDQVVTSLGVNKKVVTIVGLMISNGLVGLSGGLVAQYNGFADVGMGTGIIVKGLACVIIGTTIFGRIRKMASTTQVIIGTMIYFTAITLALRFNFSPDLLNLLTAVLIIIALAAQNGIFKFKKKKGGPIDVENKETI